ncbi:69 kDa paraflagellar rod protein [Diplonema papillatum]|nr:69 kDa paraflagellar rod protein [Diplonema papillatum]
MSRLTREREAICKATELGGYKTERGVSVHLKTTDNAPAHHDTDGMTDSNGSLPAVAGRDCPSPSHRGPGMEIDYENILADSSSLGFAELPETGVERRGKDVVPLVRSAVVKGEQKDYYSTEQGHQNLLLKAAVAENAESLLTLLTSQEEKAQATRKSLASRNTERGARLNEFDKGYRWPLASGFAPKTLISHINLSLSLTNLSELGEITHPSTAPLSTLQQSVVRQRLSTPEKDSLCQAASPVYTAYLPLPNWSDPDGPYYDTSKAQGWPKTVVERHPLAHVLVKIHDLANTDVFMFIKNELRQSQEKLDLLLQKYEEAEAAKKSALVLDDVKTAEDSHQKSISALEACIQVTRGRLSQVTMGDSDGGTFKGKYESHRRESEAVMKGLQEEKGHLKEKLLQDLDALAAHGEAKAKENSAAVQEHTDAIAKSNEKLDELTKRQDALYEEIERLTIAARVLGDERAAEVTRHVERTEEEERRKREYTEFSEVFSEHTRRLDDILKHTEEALAVMDGVQQSLTEGCRLVEGKEIDSELTDLHKAELLRYLDYFKKYVVKTNELMLSRRTRIAGIRRVKRLAEAQLMLCHQSLDPNKSKYKDELALLTSQESDLVQELENLQAAQLQQEADFAPTESMLEELDIDFVPPTIEKKELETLLRSQLLDLTKGIIDKEQDEVDKEVTTVRKLRSDLTLGKEQHTKKLETRKRNKQRNAVHNGSRRSVSGEPASPANSPPAQAE